MTAIGEVESKASSESDSGALRSQVRSAVIWRSGTQIFSQLVAWVSTFLVMRLLPLSDYGLFAMTSTVLVLLNLLNGSSFSNAVIQDRDFEQRKLRQLFGLLIAVNGSLALVQVLLAPLVASYFAEPRVADLLRVQALIYLTNPFLGVGYAVLAREMDFRRQAQVNMGSALLGAVVALVGAFSGWGVWTLVAAPLATFVSRAFGMMAAARAWILPSFDFRGARALANYGGLMMGGQIFWFIQTQADIVIAGRQLGKDDLGIYTISLFLAHIFVTKVVPPLNEVAFSAYARIQHDLREVSAGFLKSVRTIMLLAVPFCLGMAAAAEPLVRTMLGEDKAAVAPVVTLLALAMPFMTLHVLFAPATNACGRPGISTRTSILGAVLMPPAYLVGVQYGVIGLAAAWVLTYPLLTAVSAAWSLPVIGVRPRELLNALSAPVLAGIVMTLGVVMLDRALPVMPQPARLALLVSAGGAIYGGWLLAFARERLAEMLKLVLKR